MKSIFAFMSGCFKPRRMGGGFALPVVLLLLAVMSLFAVKLVDLSRTNIAMAGAAADEAVARGAADAGFALMVSRYAAAGGSPDPAGFQAMIGRARVTVEIMPEAGRIDLNTGAPVLLSGIFRIAGADPGQAEALAAEIVAYRDRGNGKVLHGADELLRFPGMDLALLERVRPYVTVYQATPGIDTRAAPRAVLLAIPQMSDDMADRILAAGNDIYSLPREDQAFLQPFSSRGRPIFTIRATAELANRVSYTREAVADLGDPYDPLILDWRRANVGGGSTARDIR